MVFVRENPIEIGWFGGIPILGNLHLIYIHNLTTVHKRSSTSSYGQERVWKIIIVQYIHTTNLAPPKKMGPEDVFPVQNLRGVPWDSQVVVNFWATIDSATIGSPSMGWVASLKRNRGQSMRGFPEVFTLCLLMVWSFFLLQSISVDFQSRFSLLKFSGFCQLHVWRLCLVSGWSSCFFHGDILFVLTDLSCWYEFPLFSMVYLTMFLLV